MIEVAGDAYLYDAFNQRVMDLASSGVLPLSDVAWPGVRYEPRRREGRLVPYLRVDHMPSSSPNYTTQIFVVWPDGVGEAEPRRVADAIVSHFDRGTIMLTSARQRIRVSRTPWVSAALFGDGETLVPVRIQWIPYSPPQGEI